MGERNNSVLEAVQGRFSTRAFLEKSVPREIIEKVLEGASWSPSGANLQPWQVVVLTGSSKRALSDAILEAYDDGVEPKPEHPYYPQQWFEPYKTRRFETGMALYNALGIERKDKKRREQQWKANYRFFDAPVGLLFLVDRRLGKACWVDMGMFIQSLMLVAREYQLATCPQAALGDYPDIIRKELNLDESLTIICGMAIGYADEQHPVNNYRTERESVASFTRWFE